MFAYVLALISFLGFVLSLINHVLAWFRYANPISMVFSITLLILGMLMVIPGTLFIFPSTITNTTGWGFRKMGHNFWRKIPPKGANLIRFSAIYGIGIYFICGIFPYDDSGFPVLLAITGISITLFAFHWISYWYHSPVEIRDDFWSIFKSRKHLKRHRKHDDLSKT